MQIIILWRQWRCWFGYHGPAYFIEGVGGEPDELECIYCGYREPYD